MSPSYSTPIQTKNRNLRRLIKYFIKCIPLICLFLNILMSMSLARFVVLYLTFLHLADVFIQSDLQCLIGYCTCIVHLYCQYGGPVLFLIVVLPTNDWLTSNLTNVTHTFVLKDVIFHNENPKPVEYVVNFLILNAKCFIHKPKWLTSPLSFLFLFLNLILVSSRRLTNNKKSATFLMHYDSFSKMM